jgi:protein-S-isoprenylcysteine O-methyltransferase Ste14
VARWQLATLTLVALIFAVGLSYASVELPLLVSSWLASVVEMPGFDSGRQFEHAEGFVAANHLRPVGLVSLAVVVLLMAAGLAMERRGTALVGAVAVFLPVFGHFAASMFFLAGLGMLRVIWLPVLDVSFRATSLGEVVFAPYAALVWVTALAGVDIRDMVGWIVMAIGMSLFAISTLTWFVARARQADLADFWVYRFSRHPQYLGWILWSYGLMLYVARHSQLYRFKISWGLGSSLPWAVAAVVIIGVALLEELRMRRDIGARYDAYCRRTPFLLPLPKPVAAAASAPMRWILHGSVPESGAQVAVVVALYLGIVVLLSVPLVLIGWPAPTGWWGFPYNVWPFG